jgi:tRNA modification GTPase
VTDDTIAAIATATGVGGVGIVRVSGPRAIAIVADMIGVAAGELDRTVRLAWARDRTGARLDQVLAFAMRAPGSFTGEDVAELHGHGGELGLATLLAAVVERGARVAEPGEFTRRAVGNGKLDLVRAEALLDVIHAGSSRAWRLAQSALAGELGERVAAIEKRGLAVLAEIEGRIDFPDDDLDVESDSWVENETHELEALCAALADGFRAGRAIREGITVALVGRVNVGKSSLLNALVGRERALVAAEPGTTRDYLEITTSWNGITVTLVDTAGLRTDPGAIEQRGIELGESRVAAADVVVVLNDGTAPWDDGGRYGERALPIRSKGDLTASFVTPTTAVVTSTPTGAGLRELERIAMARAGVADREGNEQPLVTTLRQHQQITEARDGFAAARKAKREKQDIEIIALELRAATHALARFRGVEVGDRVLDELFSRFCIGK